MRLVLIALSLLLPSVLAGQFTTVTRRSSLEPFGSDKELSDYIARVIRKREKSRMARESGTCGPIRISRKKIRAGAGRGERVAYAVIAGRVTRGDNGGPVQGAQVIWGSRSVGSTDSSGRFHVVARDVGAGDSSRPLRVRALGYNARTQPLALRAGDSVVVEARLCPSPLRLSAVVLTETASAEPSITNVQEKGVDEGGLVKLAGDYLIILRRGRLFSVKVGDGALLPVAAVNAFPPDLPGDEAWYDELLVYRDRIVVLGYSYRRGGAEVGLFHLDSDGGITYEATYNFRASDYYSSRNYAARLVGSTLVMYTPLYLADSTASTPAMRRWTPGVALTDLQPMPHRAYRQPPGHDDELVALHSLITCDLARPNLDCRATSVVAGESRVTYASPAAMYLWTSPEPGKSPVLYRLPFDGAAPTAVAVEGMPIDQFSFREEPDGGLSVFVVGNGYGESMWGAEFARGAGALVRVPGQAFGDGSTSLAKKAYRLIPGGMQASITNRFVGDWLLLGSGTGWGRPGRASDSLRVVPVTGGPLTAFEVPHAVDRIEVMGRNALVIGTAGDNLHFTPVELGGTPRLETPYVVPGAAQGELRSHGFFYKPDGPASGTLALPIRESNRPGFAHLREVSASIVFVRREGRELTGLGNLDPSAPRDLNDRCVASCVDWYGNARPIFLGERVLALLGYELVEGALRGGRIAEVRRVSFLR